MRFFYSFTPEYLFTIRFMAKVREIIVITAHAAAMGSPCFFIGFVSFLFSLCKSKAYRVHRHISRIPQGIHIDYLIYSLCKFDMQAKACSICSAKAEQDYTKILNPNLYSLPDRFLCSSRVCAPQLSYPPTPICLITALT